MRVEEYLNQGKGESLEVAERQAVAVLGAELSGHGSLTERAFNLIGVALSSLPEFPIRDIPPSQNVATTLLTRLSNDLRSAFLVAVRGYAIQSATLVSSMYEAAYAVAAIGSDDALANEWIDHQDPTRPPFKGFEQLTRDGLAKLRVPNPDEHAAIEYCVYRQLCMAKHGNPLMQKQHGYTIENGSVVIKNGPDLSEPAVRLAWFALEHAASLAFVALASFIVNHIAGDKQADLMGQTKALGAERKALEELAKARWGTEDPFPGRWGN